MYQLMLLGSALGFALSSSRNQRYQRLQGKYDGADLRYMLWSGAIAAVAAVLMQGVHMEVTLFSLLIAIWSTLNGMLYTICSMKALAAANLSVFTTFMMTGGVFIPTLGGILIWHEGLSWQKIICFILLLAGILCHLERQKGKHGWQINIYCFAVFLFNGMGGLINKVHQSFPSMAVDSGSYTVMCNALAVLVAVVLLLKKKSSFLLCGENRGVKLRSWLTVVLTGLFSLGANWILLISLLHVDASLSYPISCGGTVVFATVIAALRGEKPTGRQLLSVALTAAGLSVLAI